MKRTATTYLNAEEIKEALRPSNLRGAMSVAWSWSLVAAMFALVALFPSSWIAWVVAVSVIGGRQLALAILMHECAHYSLFKTRRLNDWIGQWFCAAPVWQRLPAYRRHHLAHHAYTSLPEDPDKGLVEAFPVPRRTLVRKFVRDIVGLTFLRRIVGLLLMDSGILTYTASTGSKVVLPRPKSGAVLKNLLRNVGPVVITNAALFGILVLLDHGYLYAVWALAYATVFSVVVRLRSIAEHAVTERSEEVFLNTRTTLAGPIARLLWAPHHVNYHLEHHLLPTVPHYRLPGLFRKLTDRGAYQRAAFETGYLKVFTNVTRPPAEQGS